MARPTWRLFDIKRATSLPGIEASIRPRHLPGVRASLPSRLLNPVLTPGLPPSILRPAQDCSSCSKERLPIAPYSFWFFGPQTLQNSQILQPAERFSNVTTLRHRSVFGAKSAQNGQLRKVRFFVSDVENAAWASKFARFPPKTGSRRSPCSEFVFCPEKPANSSPLNSSPLVTACHRFVTARFLGAKVRKSGPSSGPRSPQGFPRPDSPPRTRLGARQPAEVVRQPAELVSGDVTAPSGSVFGAKSAQNGRVRRVRFSVSDGEWDG